MQAARQGEVREEVQVSTGRGAREEAQVSIDRGARGGPSGSKRLKKTLEERSNGVAELTEVLGVTLGPR